MNHSELNEKQAVGGATCERPSKVSTDEKGVTQAKKLFRKTQTGVMMFVMEVMPISHTGQKVVVFSNKFGFQ